MSSYRWVVESLMFLMYMAFGISWMAYVPLMADLVAHFQIKPTSVAFVISLVSVSKAFVPLLAGVLAARIGLKRALLVGACLSALSILIPSAPTFPILLALRFVFGIGGAILVTLMGPMAMDWFPRSELPLVNGLNNVAVNTGITIALYTAVPLSKQVGWQQALQLYATASLVLAVLWALFGRNRALEPDPAKPKASGGPAVAILDLMKLPETWLIALAFGGPLSLYLALNTWLPSHFESAFKLPRADASAATGLFNLVGIPSAILGGWLTTRLGLRRPIIMLSGLLMPCASAALICLGDNPPIRTLAAVVLGLSFFIATSPVFTIPTELAGLTSRHVAILNGIVFSFSYILSFFSPLIVGQLKEHTGSYLPGLLLFAVGSSVTALAGYLLPETGPRRAQGHLRDAA